MSKGIDKKSTNIEAKSEETPKKKLGAKILINTILIVMVGAVISELFGVKDYVKSAIYTPSEEVGTVLDSLGLTEKGLRIARSTRPAFEDSETFNKNCESYDSEVYVLGCYNSKSDQIHVYNVKMDELDGIVESTTAHEILHAAWNRMPFWERQSISEKIHDFYNSLPEDAEIRTSMELYLEDSNKGDTYDEIHSRLGTQIADLSDELEEYYAQYFTNQDAIVAFYDSYNGVYNTLKTELNDTLDAINALNEDIDASQKHYDTWSEELNNKIVQFNNSVDDMSESEFNLRHTELESEIAKIDEYFEDLSRKVDEYNALIDSYNASALRQNAMLEGMNSNSNTTKPSNDFKLTDPDASI